LNALKIFERVPNGDWKKFIASTMIKNASAQEAYWLSLKENLDDVNANDRTKKIVHKIFYNHELSAKAIDTAFQRHVTKVDLIQTIKDLIMVVNNET